MPELPEAETIARGLAALLPGRRIASVSVLHEDILVDTPVAFRGCVRGRVIERVGRRGKKVVVELDRDAFLVFNLGMTGRLLALLPGVPSRSRPTHPALRFRLDGGGTLVFDDARRFGSVECLSSDAWRGRSAALGPEPLSEAFTPSLLAAGLRQSVSPVRSWLLDQRRIAGVGNIYANEALWRARVHPRRPARSLTRREAGRLHAALRDVLAEAIAASGTTLRDYRTASGAPGDFSWRLAVYGREGSPCPRCTSEVVRVVFGNRSAFLCPRCQEEGAPPA